jgi:hypothetical protein
MSAQPTQPERGGWLALAWAVGAVATAIPIFTPEHVPFLDWPQHAAMVAVLAGHGDPDAGFDLYYQLHPQVSTYLSFYYAGALLAKLVGVDLAMRILTVVSMITVPLATASLLRALGRSPWPSLLAFVPAWSWPLYMGFTTYVLAVPLALWTIAALVKLADREEGERRGPFVEVVIASTLLFFTHALAYGAALAVAGVALAVFHHWRRFRRLLIALAALAPSLLALTYWMVRQWTGSAAARSGALTKAASRRTRSRTSSPSCRRGSTKRSATTPTPRSAPTGSTRSPSPSRWGSWRSRSARCASGRVSARSSRRSRGAPCSSRSCSPGSTSRCR